MNAVTDNLVMDNLLRVLEIALAGGAFHLTLGCLRLAGRESRDSARHGGAPLIVCMAAILGFWAVLMAADAVGAGVTAGRVREPAWQLLMTLLALIGVRSWLKKQGEAT